MTASPGDSSERQAEWERAFAERTLPSFVKDRLNAAGDGRLPWLSTMTPAELMLSRSHGIRPVATVMGICALHYGNSWTRGHAEGWRTAVARLKWEAWAAHANAVVDVKMRTIPLGGKDNMDYALVGTAVRIEDFPPSHHPIIATTSASEFVQLLETGVVPVDIAIGVHYNYLLAKHGEMVDGGLSPDNFPLENLSRFWQKTRHVAILELQKDAREKGNGVLAHTHFSEMMKFTDAPTYSQMGFFRRTARTDYVSTQYPARIYFPRQYLGRHIVMGTVIDTTACHPVPQEIRAVVDMRDGLSPLNGGSPPHNVYPVASENCAI